MSYCVLACSAVELMCRHPLDKGVVAGEMAPNYTDFAKMACQRFITFQRRCLSIPMASKVLRQRQILKDPLPLANQATASFTAHDKNAAWLPFSLWLTI